MQEENSVSELENAKYRLESKTRMHIGGTKWLQRGVLRVARKIITQLDPIGIREIIFQY